MKDSTRGGERRWFHYGWPVALPYVFSGMMFSIAAMVMFFPGALVVRMAAAFPFVALGVLAIARLGRIGAHFRPEHLLIVRTFSSQKLPWSEVERFALARHGMSPLAGHAKLTGGRLVWIEGIGAWYRFARQSEGVEAVIAEMNRLLPDYRP